MNMFENDRTVHAMVACQRRANNCISNVLKEDNTKIEYAKEIIVQSS
jgi:hypothetical protein